MAGSSGASRWASSQARRASSGRPRRSRTRAAARAGTPSPGSRRRAQLTASRAASRAPRDQERDACARAAPTARSKPSLVRRPGTSARSAQSSAPESGPRARRRARVRASSSPGRRASPARAASKRARVRAKSSSTRRFQGTTGLGRATGPWSSAPQGAAMAMPPPAGGCRSEAPEVPRDPPAPGGDRSGGAPGAVPFPAVPGASLRAPASRLDPACLGWAGRGSPSPGDAPPPDLAGAGCPTEDPSPHQAKAPTPAAMAAQSVHLVARRRGSSAFRRCTVEQGLAGC